MTASTSCRDRLWAWSMDPAPRRRSQAPSRAGSWACLPIPESGCARASPSRGCGCTNPVRACIAGWGTAVPELRLTNADLEQRVDTTDAWIVERTGIRERRIASPEETTATLAIEAGTMAIKHAGITPAD